jgi:hypothetical protein
MAIARILEDDEPLTFGRDGTDPREWLIPNTYPFYDNERTLAFLNLYIRTNRESMHPVLAEALAFYRLYVRMDILDDAKVKGKGPRGKHAPRRIADDGLDDLRLLPSGDE